MQKNTISTTEYKPGTIFENVEIVDVTVDGLAVARHQGRVIFIDSPGLPCLPGETAAIAIQGQRKGVLTAELLSVHKESCHRIHPACSHAQDCGACVWQHYDQRAVLDWKRTLIRETMSRLGKLPDLHVAPVIPSPSTQGYRNKMVFAFGPGSVQEPGRTNACLGLRRRREHTIVEVQDCQMIDPLAMDMLYRTRELVRESGLPAWRGREDSPQSEPRERRDHGYLRFLVIRIPTYVHDGRRQIVVECITGHEHKRRLHVGSTTFAEKLLAIGNTLMEEFSLTGFIHSERRHTAHVAEAERTITRLGTSHFYERFGHCLLTVPHAAFLQTHTGAAERLYELLDQEAALTGKEVLWDVYSGIGSIGLYLAPQTATVHGFEIHKQSVQAARGNSKTLGLSNCTFHAGDLNTSLPEAADPDVIIVDPPRAGLSAPVIARLCSVPAKKLLYVSCNPATQARDASSLSERWRPVKCMPVDMFPHTPHVENVLVMEAVQ